MNPPLIIIGGGIGGLALAACLHQRHIPSRVFERAPELKEVGAALGLWPNATRVLKHLGVFESLASNACVARAGALRTHAGKILKRMIVSDLEVPGIAAHRADLLAALLAVVPQESIHLNKTCTAIEHDGPLIRARFADDSASPWSAAIVGADGLHSAVRQLTLHDGPPIYRGYIAWRGVAQIAGDQGAMTIGESWGRGQRFGVVPLGRNRVGWWATANGKEADFMGSRGHWKELILSRYGHWHSPIPEIVEATPESAILCNAILDRPPLPRHRPWGLVNTTLLGDAAHPTTPNLGQGACMAIEDAAVLAYALAGIREIPTAFRVYEATRRERTAHIVRESLRFGRIGQWQNPLACLLRNSLTRFASTGRLRRQFDDLWGYDAWNQPLVMPPGSIAAIVPVAKIES